MIDRKSVVRRHNPQLRAHDPRSPLSVGNGEFAFTADVTGLQTFPERFEGGDSIPICTMSQWGWHTTPRPKELDGQEFKYREYDTYGRPVGYATSSKGQEQLFHYLRKSPHRLNLGRLSFELHTAAGTIAKLEDLKEIYQELDLWTGVITSRFSLDGRPITVKTCCHPTRDLLAVDIESEALAKGLVAVRLAFPAAPDMLESSENKDEIAYGGRWEAHDSHVTSIVEENEHATLFARKLDTTTYHALLAREDAAKVAPDGPHAFKITAAEGSNRLSFALLFEAGRPPLTKLVVEDVFKASVAGWESFWNSGGAIDFAGSTDPRAHEIERRVVLSQYLTRIQCCGSIPPQETGLTCNSWYGKFHLEMHWWHAAHFPLWGRADLLQRSLGWYDRILPEARAIAKRQGYKGARWPKMVGPEGIDSPSPIGPVLIWQQPHPIAYAELMYKAKPTRETLGKYALIVSETADFMASFAVEKDGRFMLGPPVIPAQERFAPSETTNPTFELEYWAQALSIAQQWRERTGLKRREDWDDLIKRLSPLPVADGVYLSHEGRPDTFTKFNTDHPSFLGALGILKGTMVDKEIMRATLRRTLKEWQWPDTWGWDYPMCAMTAARLGERELAVQLLLLETPKNGYLPNGHNWQRPYLPLYLPGNGGLLSAVALMAAGWDDQPADAPGFPNDGKWKVVSEGLKPWL